MKHTFANTRTIRGPSRGAWTALLTLVLLAIVGVAQAENVDPDANGRQYAWGENLGWLNAEPQGDGGPGLEVSATEVTGWIWAENAGWISLSCQNTASCGDSSYGVLNDGRGNLSGFAWGENIGWINFQDSSGSDCCIATRTPGCTDSACEAAICAADAYCCNNNWDSICATSATLEPACSATCAPDPFGVRIHGFTGDFSGQAWAENAGWINFGTLPGPAGWQIDTSWSCDDPDSDAVCSPSDNCPTTANSAQGTALFGQTVVAVNLADFTWPTATDWQMATGTFFTSADIGTFTVDFYSTGSGTVLSDGTPAANTGYWYVWRPDCPVGSYSTGTAAELAGRDAALIP